MADITLGRAHLIAGGFPPGSMSGHDHDYARLRLLGLLAERDIPASVANDFADVEKWLPTSRLLISYVAGPYPDAAQTAAMRQWLEAGGHWLALHGSSGGRAQRVACDQGIDPLPRDDRHVEDRERRAIVLEALLAQGLPYGNEVVPQRFAIDWMMLDRRHRAWVGNPARLSSYLSYGQPLIAVATGKVVIASDGAPNQPPPDNPTPPSAAELPGNRVILRVGPGIYVTYAHMVPGSVRVHVGERVHRGQVLGRLGNSGNSATPHLHLQVQVTRSFLSDGLPFVGHAEIAEDLLEVSGDAMLVEEIALERAAHRIDTGQTHQVA